MITTKLDPGGINVAVKLALCFALLFTYVLMMFPVFEVLENNWLIRLLHLGSPEHVEWRRGAGRVGVVLLTVITAIVVPDFGYFISFVGALGCSTLAYVLPAAFHVKIASPGGWTLCKDALIFAFGIVAVCICTTTVVLRLVSGGGANGH